jgi:osmotically-inducible protein OsmY
VGRGDLLVAFARGDETTADATQRGVISRILMLESRDVSVRVADGVVMPSGQVSNRSDAILLEQLACRIEGVIRCESDLGWSFDDISAGRAL